MASGLQASCEALIEKTLQCYGDDASLPALFTGGGDKEIVVSQLTAFNPMLSALAGSKQRNRRARAAVAESIGFAPLKRFAASLLPSGRKVAPS